MSEPVAEFPKPDILSPAEIQAKAETLALGKVSYTNGKLFLLAILAGMFIGFGALYYTLVASDPTIGFATKKVFGALLFCTGLYLVLTAGSELFTGDVLMIQAFMSKKITFGSMVRVLVLVWLGNLVGSILLAYLVHYSGVMGANEGTFAASAVSIAAGKAGLPLDQMFIRGILCNTLVCFAVWVSYGAKSAADKLLAIIFPISAFVAIGFEHSVANMYFLPLGLIELGAGNAAAGFDASALTLANVATNLGIVTLGNMVGGMLFIGLFYWLIFAKKSAQN